jgi:predicted nucleic acid-binding protein
MNPEDLVLIDTCMWVPFFNRPQSNTKRVIDSLLRGDQGAIAGPVVAEVLLGFRRKAEADWSSSVLRGVRYLEIVWDDWRAAARLGRVLASRGHILPLSDLVIASVARRIKCAVYSTDPHFDIVPNLKRFRPETD